MLLARLLRSLTRLRRLQPQVGRLHAIILRRSAGRIRRSRVLAGGQPVLALTTTGRHSGKPRSTVVAYLLDGNDYVVSALNLGSDRDPAWCLNLRATPVASIEVDGQRKTVVAREATPEQADRLWQRLIARLPATANSRALAARSVPVIMLAPTAEGSPSPPHPIDASEASPSAASALVG